MLYPEKIFSQLFVAVQESQIFPDSKTFADAIPKNSPEQIEQSYQQLHRQADFDLADFLASNFIFPKQIEVQPRASNVDIWSRIEQLWDELARSPDQEQGSSLLPLPHAYTVPGGRFREIYYWDSYFTMLGLAASGRDAMVFDMVENFADLLRRYGSIPNGNRSYYLSRSQPPFFAMMVELLIEIKADSSLYLRYLDALNIEYEFWMQGSEQLQKDGQSHRRVVKLKGYLLNRYWDDEAAPRPESYSEDYQLVAMAPNLSDSQKSDIYRHIRSACESGWDFSSRWFKEPQTFLSICTNEVVPVDLNCLMLNLEQVLAKAERRAGNNDRAQYFDALAADRQVCLQTVFYDQQQQWFVDLQLGDAKPTGKLSLAGVYPLFLKVAGVEQAQAVAQQLRTHYLNEGGWLTSPLTTEHQWDAPNGWAPLQWIVFQGLQQYGESQLATQGARRWIDCNVLVYQQSGQLQEKYNVVELKKLAEGGEYQVQQGFGWTNAVLLKLAEKLNYRDNLSNKDA